MSSRLARSINSTFIGALTASWRHTTVETRGPKSTEKHPDAKSRAGLESFLYKRALEAASNGIVISEATKSGPRVVYTNPAFEQMTGYARGEIVGTDCFFLHDGAEDQEGVETLLRALGTGQTCHVTVQNFRKSGEVFWNEVTLSPVVDENGILTHFILINNDVTGQVDATQSLREAHEVLEARVEQRTHELESANADLEGFTFSVSHDLRAPLRAISGFSKVLIEDHSESLDEHVKTHLERITIAAKEMEKIINDLLTFSRLGRREIFSQLVDISQIATSIGSDLVRRHPERSVQIAVDGGMSLKGDPTMLRIVVENLVDNAYKFCSKKTDGFIQVRMVDEHTFVVRDNGVGFDPAYTAKLFKAFERLHSERDFPGTGIGLANVRRIVERHGGKVWAEGELGSGASFFVQI